MQLWLFETILSTLHFTKKTSDHQKKISYQICVESVMISCNEHEVDLVFQSCVTFVLVTWSMHLSKKELQ